MDAGRPQPFQTVPTVLHAIAGEEDLLRTAPVLAALERRGGFRQLVIQAGGDGAAWRSSDGWAAALGVPSPAHRLRVAAGLPGFQAAVVIEGFERVVLQERPVLVLVAGDHDAAFACALAARRHDVPVTSLAAGLRGWDRSVPGELNRVLTDQLADTLLTATPEGRENLLAEGVLARRIHEAGNPVVDSVRRLARAGAGARAAAEPGSFARRRYVLLALGGEARRDDAALASLVASATVLARRTGVVLSLPAGLRARLVESGGLERLVRAGGRAPARLAGLDRLRLLEHCGAVVTDSGAVQDVASILGVPCFTLGATTERPVTLTAGTNQLVGDDPAAIETVEPSGRPATPCAVPLWDRHAGERAADVLVAAYAARRPAAAARRGR